MPLKQSAVEEWETLAAPAFWPLFDWFGQGFVKKRFENSRVVISMRGVLEVRVLEPRAVAFKKSLPLEEIAEKQLGYNAECHALVTACISNADECR